MTKIHWKVFIPVRFITNKIFKTYNTTKLTFLSLFYNDFADKFYVGDSCMEPMFWFVDHFTKLLGPICVAAVMIFSLSLIIIAYAIGLPFYLKQNVVILHFALFIGHWLLINVIFYYYMAYFTEPGYPPQGAMITEAVSICKRCIAPKPPRTHHCVVCNRCILKMDHHCPWLNNCVGHFNHRYFFLFCAYTWIGVVFVIIFGVPVFYSHFWGSSEEYGFSPFLISIIESILNKTSSKSNEVSLKSSLSQQGFDTSFQNNSTISINHWTSTLYHSCVVYASLLCVAVLCALGGLLVWHARHISKGETSIESLINQKERKRLLKEGKVFKNPYDMGELTNWKIFLCIGNHRPWWHLLIPYKGAPSGNGLQWNIPHTKESHFSCLENKNDEVCFVKMA